MQTRRPDVCCDARRHGARVSRLLLWVLIATAFVIGGYVAPWLYPDLSLIHI